MDHEHVDPETMADQQMSGGPGLDQSDADEPTAAAADDDSDAPVRLDANGHLAPDMTGDIRPENVTISQGGARDIDATTVSITQGGAARVRADDMTISQGGVMMARTESLTISEGGSAFALVADDATVEDGANVFLLVAGNVSGDARPVLDWRSALALGAGLVVAWAVVRRVLR